MRSFLISSFLAARLSAPDWGRSIRVGKIDVLGPPSDSEDSENVRARWSGPGCEDRSNVTVRCVDGGAGGEVDEDEDEEEEDGSELRREGGDEGGKVGGSEGERGLEGARQAEFSMISLIISSTKMPDRACETCRVSRASAGRRRVRVD